MKTLSECHDCEKCQDKIVCIEMDEWGNTRCGYCHEIVDYSELEIPGRKEFDKIVNNAKERHRILG